MILKIGYTENTAIQLQSTGTAFTVPSLSAHMAYIVSVAAQTSIGMGPFTTEIQVVTDEDGNLLEIDTMLIQS